MASDARSAFAWCQQARGLAHEPKGLENLSHVEVMSIGYDGWNLGEKQSMMRLGHRFGAQLLGL